MSDLGNKEIMAKNIKKYMELNNKSRNDICADLGFSYSTFTDWINGNVYPRIDKIEKLANYFGIEKADLIEDNVNLSDFITQDEYKLIVEIRSMADVDKQKIKRMIAYYNSFNDFTKNAANAYMDQLADFQKAHEIELRAAHNDNSMNREEQKLIQQDLDEL